MSVSAKSLSAVWRALRADSPLVHNITNYVAMDASANVLLAAGAAPAMIHAVEESAEFTALSSALVLNVGTLSAPWVTAMEASLHKAKSLGKPVVVDPVGAGATTYRTDVARRLARQATVVRGNASEILALEGQSQSRGVDTQDPVSAAEGAARRFAAEYQCTVAVTGAVDFITDGSRSLEVHGGDELLTRVTAMGCALSALTAATTAVSPDPLTGAATACLAFAISAERAAEQSRGPGSFRSAFLDALFTLGAGDLEAAAQERLHHEAA